MKTENQKLTWITCYDYSLASVIEKSDIDMILVGDSGGMVSLGYKDTVPVTMDEMLFLTKAVRKGAPSKFIVGDMPKGSYEVSDELAILNAMRFVKESECDAIKLEGGEIMAPRIKAIVNAGISVIGHIGLTPQSATALGGYRVVGKNEKEINKLVGDASAIQEAGAFGVLLEALPPSIAALITKEATSIVFGIGAGNKVDGQLLILHDLLGLYPNFRPKFAKCYVPQVLSDFKNKLENERDLVEYGRKERKDGLHEIAYLAVQSYVNEVKEGKFPTAEFSYKDS